jgi:hypothetical protein
LLDQSTLTPLQKWREDHFGNPSNVGAGADLATPAGDQVPNLVKYALGLDPLVAATAAQLPAGSIQMDQGVNYLTLTLHRAAQPPDVSYVVEVSDDLSTWRSGGTNTVTLDDSPGSLIVRDQVPVNQASQRFLRLKISNP